MTADEEREFLSAMTEFANAAGYLSECWTDTIDDDMGWRVSLRYPFMGQFQYVSKAIRDWNEYVQRGPNQGAT